jgi:hypothetical protein
MARQLRPVLLVYVGSEHGIANAFRGGVLHPCYIDTAVLSHKSQRLDGFEFRNWSGARDLNPGSHGPEIYAVSSTDIDCVTTIVVAARALDAPTTTRIPADATHASSRVGLIRFTPPRSWVTRQPSIRVYACRAVSASIKPRAVHPVRPQARQPVIFEPGASRSCPSSSA